MNKTQFFHKPTAKEIIKGKRPIEASSNLLNIIESLVDNNEQFLRIKRDLHPFERPKKYIRHGKELEIIIPKMINISPFKYILQFMNNIKDPYYSCYSFWPLSNEKESDQKRISLVNCVDGSQLYNYIQNYSTGIKIREFSESTKIGIEGAQILVKVPSRTPKKQDYEFKFVSFPVIDNKYKYAIAYNLNTEGHNCKDKLFTNISFEKEESKKSSRFISFCDHEIAAYFCLIDYFHNEKQNLIPYWMSHFVTPTNKIIELNKNIRDKVVIEKLDENNEPKDYPLTESDREIIFWGAVKKYGPYKTFHRKNTIDGLLKDATY